MMDSDAELVDELLALTVAGDSFVVVERLHAEADPERAARAFAGLARRLYQQKNFSEQLLEARGVFRASA